MVAHDLMAKFLGGTPPSPDRATASTAEAELERQFVGGAATMTALPLLPHRSGSACEVLSHARPFSTV